VTRVIERNGLALAVANEDGAVGADNRLVACLAEQQQIIPTVDVVVEVPARRELGSSSSAISSSTARNVFVMRSKASPAVDAGDAAVMRLRNSRMRSTFVITWSLL
jgi:hypothetical protein